MKPAACLFVEPASSAELLRQGFELSRTLTSAFARALFQMFVVSEVHPFDDGNGRVARIMMNAELVAAGEHRIIIPSVYRNNYMMGLRGMSTNGHAPGLIASLDFAQRYTAAIDYTDLDTRARLTTITLSAKPTKKPPGSSVSSFPGATRSVGASAKEVPRCTPPPSRGRAQNYEPSSLHLSQRNRLPSPDVVATGGACSSE